LHALAAEAVPAEAVAAGLIQRTDEVVTAAITSFGLERTGAEVIRRAMGSFVPDEDRLFEGAEELLRTAHDRGLRTVIVSNTFWRDADGYRRDFEDLGVGDLIDEVVTSLDTGFRKPHEAMFAEALRLAGCGATECVFIGNSEELDIEPAAQRGMRTILVAIEEPALARSRADAVVTSLAEAASTLRAWTAAEDTRVQ
jgi:FMN phosphatase YigB (HAD superfamily)